MWCVRRGETTGMRSVIENNLSFNVFLFHFVCSFDTPRWSFLRLTLRAECWHKTALCSYLIKKSHYKISCWSTDFLISTSLSVSRPTQSLVGSVPLFSFKPLNRTQMYDITEPAFLFTTDCTALPHIVRHHAALCGLFSSARSDRWTSSIFLPVYFSYSCLLFMG